MAHQCKVKFRNRQEPFVEEFIAEWAIHTTYTKDGVIVNYLNEDWEKEIRHFNHEDVISIHTR